MTKKAPKDWYCAVFDSQLGTICLEQCAECRQDEADDLESFGIVLKSPTSKNRVQKA